MAKKIYRSRTNKIIGGVCGGLGEYFNVDPSIIRLFWLLACIAGGVGIIAYIVCLIIIPVGDNDTTYYDGDGHEVFKNSSLFVGVGLIIVGAILLAKKVCPWFSVKWFNFAKYWPVLLIIGGLYILFNQRKNN